MNIYSMRFETIFLKSSIIRVICKGLASVKIKENASNELQKNLVGVEQREWQIIDMLSFLKLKNPRIFSEVTKKFKN